jgi:DNA-binding IclR family transcriptional regulator
MDENYSKGMPKVRAIERAAAILRAFEPHEPKLPLGEIARKAGLDKATANRILGTLIGCDFVVQDPVSRLYWLSFDILSLGASVPGQHDLQQIAEPVLRELSMETKCLAFLATYGNEGAICLARSVIDPPVQVQIWNVGETRPYNQGAGPKLLFAHLSEDRQRAYLLKSLPPATSFTVTDPDDLLKVVSPLRGQTTTVSRDDIIVGLGAFAHVLVNEKGHVIATISVVGLTPMFIGKELEALEQCVSSAAAELEKRLLASGISFLARELD